MESRYFIVTLNEDTVISQSSATMGGHASKDYLSGSVLLGAVANTLYKNFQSQQAWQLFHSGKMRFGNALPVSDNGYPTFPVPRSWFCDKEDAMEGLKRKNAINYTAEDFLPDQRVQQYRGQYFTFQSNTDNELLAPNASYRMKTAIGHDTGVAAESELFGYTCLLAGQSFYFSLECDDDMVAHLDEIADTLTNQPVYLGKSRSAEYGSVSIREIETPPPLEQPQEDASTITLWLLSDVLLYDEYGIPTLQPKGENIHPHLKGWELDYAHSFTYSRRIALYNATYQRRELEREVIGMGSVLHYAPSDDVSNASLSVETLIEIQNHGIGSYRQAGLGKIWVNPDLLKAGEYRFSTQAKQITEPNKFHSKEPDNLLMRHLKARWDSQSSYQQLDKQAEKWADELKLLYHSARSLLPHIQQGCVGPSPTQWGRVMETAKSLMESGQDGTFNKLFRQLFDSDGICKKNDPQWDAEVILDTNDGKQQLSTFRIWFMGKLKSIQADKNKESSALVSRFAHHAKNVAKKTSCTPEATEGEQA